MERNTIVMEDGSEFTCTLDYTGESGLIGRLVDKCELRDSNPGINDTNFPMDGKNGVVAVRFRIIPGMELKSDDGLVWRNVVEAKFREMGMRFPNAAEALLVPAEDHQIGSGEYPLVAFVHGSRHAFVVIGGNWRRDMELFDRDDWIPSHEFLGVCE